jgi:hypothetical protein
MSTPQRYNLAYNYVFDKQSDFVKSVLINGDKCDRIEKQFTEAFTKEVCCLAESDAEIQAVKCNYVVPQTTGVK